MARSGEDSKWNNARNESQFGKVSNGEKIDSLNWRAVLKAGQSGCLIGSRGPPTIMKREFSRTSGLAPSAGFVAK